MTKENNSYYSKWSLVQTTTTASSAPTIQIPILLQNHRLIFTAIFIEDYPLARFIPGSLPLPFTLSCSIIISNSPSSLFRSRKKNKRKSIQSYKILVYVNLMKIGLSYSRIISIAISVIGWSTRRWPARSFQLRIFAEKMTKKRKCYGEDVVIIWLGCAAPFAQIQFILITNVNFQLVGSLALNNSL